MVNFEGTPDLVGKFVDVEIVDVYTNSLRGKIVRTEAEMGLRIAESPESVIARTRKENDLGVGIYQPYDPFRPVGSGRPCCFSLSFIYLQQCLRHFPVT